MTGAAFATSVHRPRRRARTAVAPNVLLVAAALVPIITYVVVAVRRIGYPYELTYFEGSTVEVTARVVAGQSLYGPPTTDFTPWPYPPLYFWLTGALAQVTGVNLLSLRLVSFAASLVVLVLLAVVVRRVSGSLVAGVVAAGLYAATYRVSGASADTARVDSLLLALLLAAVLVGMRARSWRGGVLLGATFLVAFLAKQNALVVAAPVLLWLLVRRRPTGSRVGLAAAATLVGGLVVSTLVGQLVTDGWYARYVIFQLPSQSWTLRWLWDFWLRDLMFPFAVPIAVLVVVLVVARRRGRLRRRAFGDEQAYLLACLAGLLLASWVARLHEGGYDNVAMPAHAALAGLFGVLLAKLLTSMRSTGWSTWAQPALLALLVLVQTAFLTLGWPALIPSPADRAAGDRLIAELQQLPGRVLVPTHPYYLRLAGLPSHASNIAIYDLLHADGGRQALGAQLPWRLDAVSAVILDNESDVQLFGPELSSDFTLVSSSFVPDGVFVPVTDTPTHPALLYLRTSELSNR
jgi:hypothetical protein